MTTSLTLHTAYVLHTRPYRNTSLLVELFSKEEGRLVAVARGARSTRSPNKGLLQPFVPILVSWYGKSELVTLRTVEPNGTGHYLTRENLISGLYLNELLIRLLPRVDPHSDLFDAYMQSITALANTSNPQVVLRHFELQLLSDLGYEPSLSYDSMTNEPVQAEAYYLFDPAHGVRCIPKPQRQNRAIFQGMSLLAIAERILSDKTVLQDCKRLVRLALAPLLGHKPLQSRELISARIKYPVLDNEV